MKYETKITEIDTSPEAMPEYQQRVLVEKRELDERISKLDTFLKGEQFKTLTDATQLLLCDQMRAMCEYSECLGERIAAFKETT